MPDGPEPYVLRPGEGWTHHLGIDITVKTGELRHGRSVAVVEYTTRAGEEPNDHVRATEDEAFYVLDGSLRFRCAGETHDAEPGTYVFVPRGVPHGYTIGHDGDVRLLVITAPASDVITPGWDGRVATVETKGQLRSAPADE